MFSKDDRDLINILMDKTFKDILSSPDIDELVESVKDQPPRLYCMFDKDDAIDINKTAELQKRLRTEKRGEEMSQNEMIGMSEMAEEEVLDQEEYGETEVDHQNDLMDAGDEEMTQQPDQTEEMDIQAAIGLKLEEGEADNEDKVQEEDQEVLGEEDQAIGSTENQRIDTYNTQGTQENSLPEVQTVAQLTGKDYPDTNAATTNNNNDEGVAIQDDDDEEEVSLQVDFDSEFHKIMQREEFLESVEVIFEDAFLDVIKDITGGKFEVKNVGSSFRTSLNKIKTINRLMAGNSKEGSVGSNQLLGNTLRSRSSKKDSIDN